MQIGEGPVTVGGNVVRIRLDHLVEILERLVVFFLRTVNDRTVDVAGGVIRLGFDRVAKCLNRFVHFSGTFVGETEVIVIVGFLRIRLDRLLEKIDRLVPLLVFRRLDPILAVLIGIGFFVSLGDRRK